MCIKRRIWFYLHIIFICLMICSVGCGGRYSIPQTYFEQNSIKTITSWRIIGPFKLPPNEQVYTLENEKNAFNHDFLASIGGSESPFTIGKPSSRYKIDFDRDATAYAPSSDKNAPFMFLNQRVDFPVPQVSSYMIFSTNTDFFKVMYAAADIEAKNDSDAVLIVSGNSPTRIWMNNAVVADSPGGSVGNAQQIQHLVKVKLKKGLNAIVVKMYCFPYLNEFCVRIAGEKSARMFVQEKAGLRDVLETVFYKAGGTLRLTKNLLYYMNAGADKWQYKIYSAVNDNPVASGTVFAKSLEIPLNNLHEGLYTLAVRVLDKTYSQKFYIGSPSDIYPAYSAKCGSFAKNKDRAFDPCLSLAGLQEIHKEADVKGFRQDWQKKAIVYASMIEAGFNPELPGFRMHAYSSKVDGQQQYFLFYRPQTSLKGARCPVVVEVPHNAYGAIVSQDPDALITKESKDDPFYKLKTQSLVNRDANYLLRLALFCDEYGYACLFPFSRFRQFEDPLAVTDMLQVFEESMKIYSFDEDRIYMRGFCRGGGNAIKLAEHYPDRFAAVFSMNLNVHPDPFPLANSAWTEISDIRNLAENLKYVPVQLIHGKHFPHSPTDQSQEFYSLCRKNNVPAQFEIFEGDAQWDDRDEYRISFDFFRNKKRMKQPESVAYATGQLKYSSAYWVSINRLQTSTKLGHVRAEYAAPNRITLKTDNVGAVEINRRLLPASAAPSGPLEIIVNGQRSVPQYSGGNPIVAMKEALPRNSLQKNKIVEGPIAHAFAAPFVVIQGSGGPREGKSNIQAVTENIRTYWEGKHFVPLRRKWDHEITAADIKEMNLVIIGDLGQSTLLKPVMEKLPLSFQQALIKIGDYQCKIDNALVVMAYPNPVQQDKYVVIVKANNYRALVLSEPDLARYGSDVMIWERFVNGKIKLAGQWFWDESWSHLIPVTANSPQ